MKLAELEKQYDLELDSIVREIKKQKAKRVLLQFPDGLKQYALDVVDFLEEATKQQGVEFVVWGGSCFGACDTPQLSQEDEKEFDLFIQFGHAAWK